MSYYLVAVCGVNTENSTFFIIVPEFDNKCYVWIHLVNDSNDSRSP